MRKKKVIAFRTMKCRGESRKNSWKKVLKWRPNTPREVNMKFDKTSQMISKGAISYIGSTYKSWKLKHLGTEQIRNSKQYRLIQFSLFGTDGSPVKLSHFYLFFSAYKYFHDVHFYYECHRRPVFTY